MKTKAAVLYRTNEPLQIKELEVPPLEAGQVLVKISYSGLCHTQINEIRGLKGEDKFLPHTLGHEGAGIVQEIGAGVQKVNPGDHVVATWIQGAGMQAVGTAYKDNGTIINSGAISTFMQYAVIAENRLVKINNRLPLRLAALLGCAVPTGAGIVLNAKKEFAINSIAIFGAGGIGLSAVMAASSEGIPHIIVVDIVDQKLQQASGAGATHTINALKSGVISDIHTVTNNTGVDCAVECAGTKATMEMAFQATKYNGGVCILAGNLRQGETISIDPMGLIKGRRLIGSWGGSTNPDQDIPVYVTQYLSGKLKLDQLITHEYKLEEINIACNAIEEKKVGRAIINME